MVLAFSQNNQVIRVILELMIEIPLDGAAHYALLISFTGHFQHLQVFGYVVRFGLFPSLWKRLTFCVIGLIKCYCSKRV